MSTSACIYVKMRPLVIKMLFIVRLLTRLEAQRPVSAKLTIGSDSALPLGLAGAADGEERAQPLAVRLHAHW